jgi:hypothetical protein
MVRSLVGLFARLTLLLFGSFLTVRVRPEEGSRSSGYERSKLTNNRGLTLGDSFDALCVDRRLSLRIVARVTLEIRSWTRKFWLSCWGVQTVRIRKCNLFKMFIFVLPSFFPRFSFFPC